MTMTRRSLLGVAMVGLLAGCAAPTVIPAPTTGPASPGPAPAPPRRPPAGPAQTRLTGQTSAPMTRLAHLPVVEASVNGDGPYRFVIDSGSVAPLRVSASLASRLPQVGVVHEGDPNGVGSRQVPIVRIDVARIGEAEFAGVDASVGADLGELRPDGIVGIGLFQELTATLDYPGGILHLAHNLPLADGPHVVGFSREFGVPRISVRAGDATLEADIDTGGPAVLTVPSAAPLPWRGTPTRIGTGRGARGEFEIFAAQLDGDLTIAGWTRRSPTVHIADGLPGASIGAAFLSDYAVTFDGPGGRLALLA